MEKIQEEEQEVKNIVNKTRRSELWGRCRAIASILIALAGGLEGYQMIERELRFQEWKNGRNNYLLPAGIIKEMERVYNTVNITLQGANNEELHITCNMGDKVEKPVCKTL